MYLIGASGHAKVIIDILKTQHINILGLFDDNPDLKSLLEYPVLGKLSLDLLKDDVLIISIGNNKTRKKVVGSLPENTKYGRAISPLASVSEYAKVDAGTVIMQGAVIQSSTIIGKHCIINTQASVDHDCLIEDFVHISPHGCLCGGVAVGEGSQIGAGAVVIPGVSIGAWSIIGAGSVVLRDIPDGVVVAGNPAKIIRHI